MALVALLAFVCCGVPVESAAAGQLKGIRSSAEADSTRVIIELSEVRSYRYGVIPGDARKGLPARLYVDIDGIKLERNRKVELWVGDQRVKQVRAGQNTLQKARVVLELEGMVKPTVFALESPPRIVIELKGTGAASRGAPVVAKAGTVKAPPVRPSSSKPATAVVPPC